MLCPVCEIEMIILEMLHVEIDYCHKCGGIWLDEGELELLLKDEETSTAVRRTLLDNGIAGEKGMKKCPVCRKNMKRVILPAGKGVEIDKCPKSHGLWFDKGELQEVASHSNAEPVSAFLKNIFNPD